MHLARALRRAARRGVERLGLLGPYYRAQERRIAKAASVWRPQDGGLATPPPELVAVVAGHADLDGFLEQGRGLAGMLTSLAHRHGGSLTQGCVLDFGCGCGRTARHLAPQVIAGGGVYVGVDINPALVRWCAGALPGVYRINGLRPPATVAVAEFDLLFSVSVFTHLPRAAMQAWLNDHHRVLRPGGLALISFADEGRVALADAGRPDAPLAPRLSAEGFAVSTRALEGSNFMSSYASVEAFNSLCVDSFEVLEIVPSALSGETLAWAVLRNRE